LVLEEMLSDTLAEAQKRLEQLEAKLADGHKTVQLELIAEKSQCAQMRAELLAVERQKQLVDEAVQSNLAELASLRREVEMLRSQKLSLESKHQSSSKAQLEAQSRVAALDQEVAALVTTSKLMLADAKADAQKRLGQLEAKLADAERAQMELVDRESEALRKLEEEARNGAAMSEKAAAAQREAETSRQEALTAAKGLETMELLLRKELKSEKWQCVQLREEIAALQKQNSNAVSQTIVQGELSSLRREVEMLGLQKSTLEAKLADAERAQMELVEREFEGLRKLDENARNAAAMLEKAASAIRETERSKLAAVTGLEKVQQQLEMELDIERKRCAQLREDVATLQKQNAIAARMGRTESVGANSDATLMLLSRLRSP
jgi:chromosome segregation ATPase